MDWPGQPSGRAACSAASTRGVLSANCKLTKRYTCYTNTVDSVKKNSPARPCRHRPPQGLGSPNEGQEPCVTSVIEPNPPAIPPTRQRATFTPVGFGPLVLSSQPHACSRLRQRRCRRHANKETPVKADGGIAAGRVRPQPQSPPGAGGNCRSGRKPTRRDPGRSNCASASSPPPAPGRAG